MKLGFNPIFEFEGKGLEKNPLDFGVRIECPDGGCNGLPCELNPSKEKYGDVVSDLSASGAGGSSFCVVTVPSGSKANIVVFHTDGSEGDYDEDDEDDDDDKDDDDEPTTTSKPSSSSSSSSSSSKAPKSTSSSSSSSSRPTVGPGIFREQANDEDDDDETSSANASASFSPSRSSDSSDASETDDEDDAEEDEPNNAPGRQSNAVVGLVVAVAAAACFY